jgi:Osmosensitive K+ channel histidine kinase
MEQKTHFIYRICQPKENIIKGEGERDLYTQKHARLVVIQLVLMVIKLLYGLIILPSVWSPITANVTSNFIELVMILLLCRTHPKLLTYLYLLSFGCYVLLARLLLKDHLKDHVFSCLSLTQINPIAAIYVGEHEYFLIALSIPSLLYLYSYMQEELQEAIIKMGTAEFIARLTTGALLQYTIVVVFLLGISSNFKLYQNKMLKIEAKKVEAERQKLFILGFSHELRNLINNIIGNVHVPLLEDLNPKIRECLNNARVSGEMLLHLIDNILDLGKLEVGELEINTGPVSIYDSMKAMWEICAAMIKRKGLQGKLYISKKLPAFLEIDAYRLNQIIYNLISNAVKYTRRGYVSIVVDWIENRNQIDEICYEPYPLDDEGVFEKSLSMMRLSDDYELLATENSNTAIKFPNNFSTSLEGILKITVFDTGIGIDSQHFSHLFQKFRQVSEDGSRKLATGLGLYITKELCTRMNGEIRVFSKLSKGSCFVICIPTKVRHENSNVSGLSRENREERRRKLTCLLVDDVEICITVLVNYCNNLNIEALDSAADGKEAFEKYRNLCEEGKRPDIVTMDIEMPIWNGKQASKKIREYEKKKGLKPCLLIIISANCTESEMKECLNTAGDIRAQEFLKKPVTIEDLKRIIYKYYGKT